MTDPFATGVLQKDVHDRLVAGLDGYARDAGIPKPWIWTPLADTCGPEEISWVRRFPHHAGEGVQGLIYTHISGQGDPETRMAAIAGALVRNFVRARVMTLGTVLDMLAEREAPVATCLLIPNFCMAPDEGGGVSKWQVGPLYDLLVARGLEGKQTVLYASSLNDAAKLYGSAMGRLLSTKYVNVKI